MNEKILTFGFPGIYIILEIYHICKNGNCVRNMGLPDSSLPTLPCCLLAPPTVPEQERYSMEEEREDSQIWWVGVLLQRSLYPDTVGSPLMKSTCQIGFHASPCSWFELASSWLFMRAKSANLCFVSIELSRQRSSEDFVLSWKWVLIQTTSIDKATIIENSSVSRHHAWTTSVVEFP